MVGWLLAKTLSVRVTAWHVSDSLAGWFELAHMSGFEVRQVGIIPNVKQCLEKKNAFPLINSFSGQENSIIFRVFLLSWLLGGSDVNLAYNCIS